MRSGGMAFKSSWLVSLMVLAGSMLIVGCGSSAPATIIDLTGNGNYTSKNFDTPPNGWKFSYDYSCKWDSGTSGISIGVGDAQNPNADPGPIVFEDSVKKKSGTSDALNGGSWYFKVETFGNTCSWHVSVPKS
jgi:hypothetical protein